MKKVLLSLLGVLIALPGIARDFNYTYAGQTLTYTVIDEEAKTCQTKDDGWEGPVLRPGNKVSGELIIPKIAMDGDTGYTVTSLGLGAFFCCSGLKSVTFPESLTSISGNAFYGCSGLMTVTFPESLTSIGESAFNGCSGLTTVTFPESLSSIGRKAFKDCSGLTTVTFPESLTSIDWGAFNGCSGLTTVTFPGSLTSIGVWAFYGCSGLTLVKSTAMTPPVIQDDSFDGLYATVPLSVPTDAFNDYIATNWGLFENFRIGDSEEIVTVKTFETGNLKYRLSPVKSEEGKNLAVVMPGDYSALTEVTIPERITYADNGSNERYYVDAIGYKAFKGCSNLETVTFNSRNAARTIGGYAFAGTNISAITMPKTIESIGDYAFSECTSLSSVEIPGSVRTIGDYAFYKTQNLGKVTFNEGLESIGESAFFAYSDRNVEPIYIPSTLKSVGKSAFYNFNCRYVNISDLASWCNIDFANSNSNPNRKGLYLNGEIITDLVIPESVKAVKDYTFCYNSTLESVAFNDALHNIGESAFYRCTSLKSVAFNDALHSIGKSAFYECTSLKSVAFNDALHSIGESAFYKCSGLTAVTIPGNVTAIGDYAFYNTKIENLIFAYGAKPIEISVKSFEAPATLSWNRPMEAFNLSVYRLKNLTIGNSVAEIPAAKFKNASELSAVTLGNSLTAIGDKAFNGCTALTEVILPPSVETIGVSAFAGNSKLASIIMGHNVKSIGEKAFDFCPAQTVSITAQTPPTAPDNTFSKYTGNLYVQGEKVLEAYYDTDYCWFQFEGHVMIEPTELKVEGDKKLTGKPGDTFQLTAKLYPEDVTLTNIFWRSTNPDIATVDPNGLVTLHADMSDIMAMAEGDDSQSNSCKIIAESLYANGPVAEIEVTNDTSGIEDVVVSGGEENGEIDFNQPVEVYSINGMRVAASVDGLPAGFYVVRQGKAVKKIVVR